MIPWALAIVASRKIESISKTRVIWFAYKSLQKLALTRC
jgi:hypothetical protein